jgi:hypothetical protein
MILVTEYQYKASIWEVSRSPEGIVSAKDGYVTTGANCDKLMRGCVHALLGPPARFHSFSGAGSGIWGSRRLFNCAGFESCPSAGAHR